MFPECCLGLLFALRRPNLFIHFLRAKIQEAGGGHRAFPPRVQRQGIGIHLEAVFLGAEVLIGFEITKDPALGCREKIIDGSGDHRLTQPKAEGDLMPALFPRRGEITLQKCFQHPERFCLFSF